MNPNQLNSLHIVLEHFLDDESEDFWNGANSRSDEDNISHIYRELLILQEYYDEQNKESTEEFGEDWHSQGDGDYEYLKDGDKWSITRT